MREKIQAEFIDDDRFKFFNIFIIDNFFTVEQASLLLQEFDHDKSKQQALESIISRVIKRPNIYNLSEVFTFKKNRENALVFIEQYLRASQDSN